MKAGLHVNLSQTMAMTPQLLQSIRLLQLSSLELEQELREALESNVMLEAVEPGDAEDAPDTVTTDADDAVFDPPASEGRDAVSNTTEEVATIRTDGAEALAEVSADFEWSSAESWSGGEPPHDEAGDSWEARMAQGETGDVHAHVLEQLQLVVQTPRQAQLVAAIVEAVDDNGYLTRSLEQIAEARVWVPPLAEGELEAALRQVHGVEPSGYGARDLRECLWLQLAALPPQTPGRALALSIVDTELALLASHDVAALARALEVDPQACLQAVDLVLALNPKPGASMELEAQAAVPDLVVSGQPGLWKVALNAERLPRVRVNALYERMLTVEKHRAMREQLQEARWLVRGIEMRQDTLLRAGQAIFERQVGFLERGEEGMAALTLREIADAIGMHESTISRVTSNKWVQTPWGVYELKAFFPSQLTGREGDTSGTAVKAMIRRIIDAETTPLSDSDITAQLARSGVQVARRTVAKYREAMRIAPVKERKAAARRETLRQQGQHIS